MTDSVLTPEESLKRRGLVPPEPFPPAASYIPVRVEGNIAYISGHGPMRDGGVAYPGKLGAELGIEDGYQSAQLTMLNILASLKAEIGELSRVSGFLKLLVLVNATEEFDRHFLVADGASDLILDVFGADSVHARSAIGVASLPFRISTEIEAIVTID